MPNLVLDTSNRTASAYNPYTDLAQPTICAPKGSNRNESSSIVCLGGSGDTDASKKSWTQRFFDSASKIFCIGPIFKMIAGWFNIQVEGNEGNKGNRGVDRNAQAKAKATIEKIFSKDEAPGDKQIKKAQAEFRKLSLYGKLVVIQQLLDNGNCTNKVGFSFIQMLGKDNLAALKKRIQKELGDNEDTTPDAALKKCKSEAVKTAVAALLEKVETEGVKLITKTFSGKGGEYPNAKARKAALEVFRGLESPVAQLFVLLDLLENTHITEEHRAEFFAALSKGTKATAKAADDSDEEEVEKTKGKKGAKTKKKDEVGSDSDQEDDGDIKADNVQGRLLQLIKGERHEEEEEATARYNESMKVYEKLKKTGIKDPDTNAPVVEPTKPLVFNNLKDYVNASAKSPVLREIIQLQTKALLQDLRSGSSANDEND